LIRGVTQNVLLPPVVNRNVHPLESVLPVYEQLYNGRVTDRGKWKRRNGYAVKWTLPVQLPVVSLIPEGVGYAITNTGRVIQLGDTVTILTGKLDGLFRPTWINANGSIILADGGPLKVLTTSTVENLAGSPPRAKWVDTIDSYVIAAGQNDYTFQWSAPGSTTSWPAANFNSVLKEGDPIVFMGVAHRELYLFKRYSIEVWVNVGGLTVFARRAMINLLGDQQKGDGIAGSSVTFVNGMWHFILDRQAYRLQGTTAQLISQPYRRELDALNHPDQLIGFDYRKEHCWVLAEPIEGRTMVYDYLHEVWSEDTVWSSGGATRMPVNAYMELDGTAYLGDYASTGLIYEWSSDYSNDHGAPIRPTRKFTVPLGADGHQRRINQLRFRLQRGEVTTGVLPHCEVIWGFDQNPYTETELVSLGQTADYGPYIEWMNLGVGRELNMQIIEHEGEESLITEAWVTAEPLGA